MRLQIARIIPACLCLVWGVGLAQVANLTGGWHLNVDKSKWGEAKKPLGVVLHIDHNEPALAYRGEVTYENDSRDFAFTGAIDGKPYAMTRSYGAGNIVLRRVDSNTVESVFRTADGTVVETARTTVSRDGKTLTRALHVKTPEGVQKWTEIYERR